MKIIRVEDVVRKEGLCVFFLLLKGGWSELFWEHMGRNFHSFLIHDLYFASQLLIKK